MSVLSCCEHRMYNPKASPTTAGEGTWRTHSHSQQKKGFAKSRAAVCEFQSEIQPAALATVAMATRVQLSSLRGVR